MYILFFTKFFHFFAKGLVRSIGYQQFIFCDSCSVLSWCTELNTIHSHNNTRSTNMMHLKDTVLILVVFVILQNDAN